MEWTQQTARQIRADIFLAASSQKFAHLASSFSCVEILSALYFLGALNYRAEEPDWAMRDHMILSKGHGALALYACLCRAGYFDRDELFRFCAPGSMLGAEPSAAIPGVEACGGSLGHGLPFAVGIALSKKMDQNPSHTYVILGDGEAQEGSVWEAVMAAKRFELANLTVILDANGVQKMDSVREIIGISSWAERFSAFGWAVKEVDGHDAPAIAQALRGAWPLSRPRLLIARTVKGKGVSAMENNPAWHWRMPNRREMKTFLSELTLAQEDIDHAKSVHHGAV